MYKNPGKKIKIMAFVFFILFTIASIVVGAIEIEEGYYEALGPLLIVFGWVVGWGLSLLIYGFGTLVENSDAARRMATFNEESKSEPKQFVEKALVIFKNPGKKIKIMACVFLVLFTIASIVVGAIEIEEGYYEALGPLLIVFGWVVGWGQSLLIYGFGTLVENSDAARRMATFNKESKSEPQQPVERAADDREQPFAEDSQE